MTPAEHHSALVAYLKSCLERGDYHGVSDAANDLRVLEATYSQEKSMAHDKPDNPYTGPTINGPEASPQDMSYVFWQVGQTAPPHLYKPQPTSQQMNAVFGPGNPTHPDPATVSQSTKDAVTSYQAWEESNRRHKNK